MDCGQINQLENNLQFGRFDKLARFSNIFATRPASLTRSWLRRWWCNWKWKS